MTSVLLLVPAEFAYSQTAITTSDENFDKWSSLARSNHVSPAAVGDQDLKYEWVGPDSSAVKVVVKVPTSKSDAAPITLDPPASNADARPLFESAVRQAIEKGVTRIVLTKGIYNFPTTSGRSHILLEKLNNITIEGNGSTFVFNNNADGILIQSCNRLRLQNINIKYNLVTASLMHAIVRNGMIDLESVDKSRDAPTDITYISEYNMITRSWVKSGIRLIYPPSKKPDVTRNADGTLFSPEFRKLNLNQYYMVFHYFYGGVAIVIDDGNKRPESNDIILDRIHVTSSPGMGIVASRMGRGLAVINSEIKPQEKDQYVSTLFDAIHVRSTKGDIIIANNKIMGQGDDAINLEFPVDSIKAVSDLGGGKYSIDLVDNARNFGTGDTVTFFDGETGKYAGSGRVEADPVSVEKYTLRTPVTLQDVVPLPGMIVRNMKYAEGRFVIAGNSIAQCQCHALLAQIPNGLVENNVVNDIDFNAMRLITNVGQWNEGVGAFNIMVRNNKISNTGPDVTLRFPFGVISAYAVLKGRVSDTPANDYITIEDNMITDYKMKCISVYSSDHVSVTKNTCTNRGAYDDDLVWDKAQRHMNMVKNNFINR